MSGGKHYLEFVNEPWDEKKQRVAPQTAPMPPQTALMPPQMALYMRDAAALHKVLMRICFAEDNHEVLGIAKDRLFELEEVQLSFEVAFEVLRHDNVMAMQPLLMPIARKALKRLQKACNAFYNELETIGRTLVMAVARARWHVRNAVEDDDFGLD